MQENNNEEMQSLQRPAVPGNNNNVVEQTDEEERGITLGQIWHMIVKHWIAVVICMLAGLAVGVVYARAIKKPEYKATRTLAVIAPKDDNTSASNNVNNSLYFARIAVGYIKYPEVEEAACKLLVNGDTDNKKGYAKLFVSETDSSVYNTVALDKLFTASLETYVSGNSTATSIFIDVTSTTSVAQLSTDVVNAIVQALQDVSNTSGSALNSLLDQTIFPGSEARVENAKDTSTSNVIIGAVGTLAGVVVGAAYAIVRELADTKVGSKAELETLTGYKVIGMIPKYEAYAVESSSKKEGEEGGKVNA